QAVVVTSDPVTSIAGEPMAQVSKSGNSVLTISAPSAPTLPAQSSARADVTLAAAGPVNPGSSPSPQRPAAAAPPAAPTGTDPTVVTGDKKSPGIGAPGLVAAAEPQPSPT